MSEAKRKRISEKLYELACIETERIIDLWHTKEKQQGNELECTLRELDEQFTISFYLLDLAYKVQPEKEATP